MNKKEIKEFLETLHFHGYIDHDITKLENLIDDYYPKQLPQTDVRRIATEWWNELPSKTKKQLTDTNKDILIKGIERNWQRLTGREIEKLYKIQHFA